MHEAPKKLNENIIKRANPLRERERERERETEQI